MSTGYEGISSRSLSLKLIAGLGNPGVRYRMNRHNAGFMVLDQLALLHDISIDQNLFDAHVGKGKIAGTPVILAKPQTFMNLSGIAARKLADYFRLDSVAHYLVVDLSRRLVLHYRRQVDQIVVQIVKEGRITLDPPGFDIAVDEMMPETTA